MCSCPVALGQGTSTRWRAQEASRSRGRRGWRRCKRSARGRTQVLSSPGPLLTSTMAAPGGGTGRPGASESLARTASPAWPPEGIRGGPGGPSSDGGIKRDRREKKKCGWRDLNSQGRSHTPLKRACLPIPPHPLVSDEDREPCSTGSELQAEAQNLLQYTQGRIALPLGAAAEARGPWVSRGVEGVGRKVWEDWEGLGGATKPWKGCEALEGLRGLGRLRGLKGWRGRRRSPEGGVGRRGPPGRGGPQGPRGRRRLRESVGRFSLR